MGSNPAAPTKRRMLKGTRLFLCPQERIPVNATDPTKSTISTVSRCPPKPTKPTVSTKSRFHDTPRKARFQRNQRNHDFTVPQRNHESNETHEKNETPGKKAFRCFRCVCINRDFVGNVAQARPKGRAYTIPKTPSSLPCKSVQKAENPPGGLSRLYNRGGVCYNAKRYHCITLSQHSDRGGKCSGRQGGVQDEKVEKSSIPVADGGDGPVPLRPAAARRPARPARPAHPARPAPAKRRALRTAPPPARTLPALRTATWPTSRTRAPWWWA